MKQVSPLDPQTNQVVMKRLNYEKIAGYMNTYPAGVFIEDIDRKTAYWAKRRLQDLTHRKIESYPILTTDKREGYGFKFADSEKV